MDRMEGERLTKRADALRVESRRTIGRQTPRWEDCVKRDLSRAGGVWRTRPRDTWWGDGGGISDEEEGKAKIDDRYRCQPHPGLLDAVYIYVTSDGTLW